MAAAAILNFQKVLFWTPGDTCIVHIYQRTKCGANRSRFSSDLPFCVFAKMAAAAILDLLFFHFGSTSVSLLLDSMFVSCRWRNDQPEYVRDIAILPLRDFGWKMHIPPILDVWGF